MSGRSGREAVREHEVLEAEREYFLRSLRDLEVERAAGDIAEGDYETLRDDYTARAADVLRRLSAHEGSPQGPGALPADGTGPPPAQPSVEPAATGAPGSERRREPRWRVRRGVRRSGIALGVLLCVGGAGWSLAAASGARMPGATITGSAPGSQGVAQLIVAAQAAEAAGNPVVAVRDYQRVLATQPDNPIALTGEAAILVASKQVKLAAQAALLLARAEQVDPVYAPAYAELGQDLLLLGDDARAETQLERFLSLTPHDPLAPQVRRMLAYARAHASQSSPPSTAGSPAAG